MATPEYKKFLILIICLSIFIHRMTFPIIASGASLTIGNGYVVRFEIEEIEGEYVTRAEQELRETPANRLAGIEGLRELLKGKKATKAAA